jgi:hypothetical protein
VTDARIRPHVAPPPVKAQPREQAAPLQTPSSFRDATRETSAKRGRKQPGLQMDAAIVVVPAAEPSVALEQFWTEVDGHLPCGFVVTTRDGHPLEVVVEQKSYRKVYTGVGALKTGLTPIAPIGTKGRIVAKDMTSGETVEQPWTWRLIGRSGGLWQTLKKLLWKGD